MKRTLPVAAAMLVAALPLAAAAQSSPPAPGNVPGGPSPEMRARMQSVRDATKTAAFNDLSPDHRARVQAVVDQVNAGTLTDPRDAVSQIDVIVSPDEAKAVLGERDKMRQQMLANRPAGAPEPQRRDGAGPSGARRQASAGAFLLQLGLSPERMRALREQYQGQGQRPPG